MIHTVGGSLLLEKHFLAELDVTYVSVNGRKGVNRNSH